MASYPTIWRVNLSVTHEDGTEEQECLDRPTREQAEDAASPYERHFGHLPSFRAFLQEDCAVCRGAGRIDAKHGRRFRSIRCRSCRAARRPDPVFLYASPAALRERQDALLERYLCSDAAVPSDLESARFWRSGAN